MASWLPVGVAAFIGRGRERAKVVDLVSEARVVTLTGTGGCGKARLALEVAGDLASRFSDGACWVDLQGVSEPGLVAPTVGAAVGIHQRPDEALIDTLADQLRARRLLVVLDSCEHLAEACADVVDHVPGARVHEIPGAAHAAPLTHPEVLAKGLGEVFASLPDWRTRTASAKQAGPEGPA